MKPVLETDNISFSFGGFRVIDGITLLARSGEILGIIGPNGSGKSTFFDLLSGFRTPHRGRIRLQGHDVTRMAADARARLGLGRTFQHAAAFYGLTVEEHLWVARLAKKARDPARAEGVDRVVTELLEATGITARWNEPVQSMSAGECRILDLARAVSQAPSALLVDEPFAGIDSSQEEAVATCIRQASAMQTCVLVVEHRLKALFSLVTRVLIFREGRVFADGAPGDILGSGELLRAYRGDRADSIRS